MAIDFGLLPPEINSTRMYTGPGAGPLLAAAAAWDDVAAQLHATAASYSSLVSGLTAGWRGPASASMTAAAAPYAAWMNGTAVQAEQTAIQARAAAAAFEIAFAATVPPAAVTANRARLLALIATNFFGQNTPAIMATQAEYIEMWAQDAAAMYGYAGSSAAAAQVMPFTPAPQTTNPAGTTAQASAVTQATSTAAGVEATHLPRLMSVVPQFLRGLATPAAPTAAAAADPPSASTLTSVLSAFTTGTYSPFSLYAPVGSTYLFGWYYYLTPQAGYNYGNALSKVQSTSGGALAGGGPGLRMVGTPVLSAPGASAPVVAGMGRAGLVGGLSVPQGWASAAPKIKALAAMVPESLLSAAPAALAADGQGSMFGSMVLSGLAGRAMAGTGGAAARSAGIGGAAQVAEATTANIFVIHEAGE